MQESVYDAFYRLTNAHSQITAYVFDVVRAIVPKSNLDDVFHTKEEVLPLFFLSAATSKSQQVWCRNSPPLALCRHAGGMMEVAGKLCVEAPGVVPSTFGPNSQATKQFYKIDS